MPDTVLDLADRFHDALVRRDLASLERIIRAYTGIQTRLQGEIDALALEIERDGVRSKGQLERMERYKRLLAETRAEVERFTVYMEQELPAMGREYVMRGLKESRALMTAAVNDNAVLVARFRDLAPETVERLLGFLDPDGPLFARLKLLPGYVAEKVAQTIINSVALGRNPRVLGRELSKAYGMGMADAMRMARTVQLYSYREASRANYAANDHIVKGWQWRCTLDGLVCPACLAMNGTKHELSEKLSGHHNCRCAPIPYTILSPNGHEMQSGEDYLKSLPKREQQKLLGKGRWQAWRDGKFKFSDIVGSHDDEVYGEMFSAKSLKDLITPTGS
jgi:hypothetical protein